MVGFGLPTFGFYPLILPALGTEMVVLGNKNHLEKWLGVKVEGLDFRMLQNISFETWIS